MRDFDLVAELASITYVNVAATITASDDNLQRVIEPQGVSTTRRFAMLKEFRQHSNASTGVHVMPMIPYITDTYENLDQIFATTREFDLGYLITASLNLRGQTRRVFMAYIRKLFPQYAADLYNLYRDGHLDKEYKIQLYKKVSELYKKHSVSANYVTRLKRHFEERRTPIETLLMAYNS